MLPAWLDEPLRAVLHDLQQPTPVRIKSEYRPGADGDELLVRAGGNGVVMVLSEGDAGAGLMVHIADQLQEQVFPESDAAWAEARPACPGHPHPAVPRELDGQAWWVCPRDERRIARIGEYAL
jgi:hypothetical protein